jgi:hypothetical protein
MFPFIVLLYTLNHENSTLAYKIKMYHKLTRDLREAYQSIKSLKNKYDCGTQRLKKFECLIMLIIIKV